MAMHIEDRDFLEVPVPNQDGIARAVNLHHIMNDPRRVRLVKVDSNKVAGRVELHKLIDVLSVGDSIGSSSFCVNQWHPLFGGWVFDLHIYPYGHVYKPNSFIVDLMFKERPARELRKGPFKVVLTVKTYSHNIELQDIKYKYFNLTHPVGRRLRLSVPLEPFRNRYALELSVQIDPTYNYGPINDNNQTYCNRLFSVFKNKCKILTLNYL